jgi:hypothetical protein
VPWVGKAQAVGQRVTPLVRMNAAIAASYSSSPMIPILCGMRPDRFRGIFEKITRAGFNFTRKGEFFQIIYV